MLILWEKLNGKETTKFLHLRYFSELLQFTCNMFAWNLPESIKPEYLEKFLNCNGIVGVMKTNENEFTIGMGGTTGKLNQYGIGDMFNGNTLGGGENDYIWGKIGEKVAICWNNTMHTPNLDISRVAQTLAEYDKSIFRITQMTRANPIFAAKNDNVKHAIENAESKIVNGDIVCVLSDNVLSEYQSSENLTKIEITEPRYSEYLQFLNEGKDAEYKRYYQKYGHAMQASSKHTTTLIDELHGADSVSFITPLDMLKCRQEFCEMANEMFGGGFSVDFSDVWKREFEKYKSDNENSKRLENENAETKNENAETKNENESEVNENG